MIAARERIRTNFALVDQIRRSSGSIMDNIAEGYERDGNREFMLFLGYAKGSAGELRSQLYRMADLHYINEEEFNQLSSDVAIISKKIYSLISYLKKSEFKGNKFKK
jgi:four helix bundle protein